MIRLKIKSRKQAKADGDKYHYTGKPCKRGHHAYRDKKGTCVACRAKSSSVYVGPEHYLNKHCCCDFCFKTRVDNEIYYPEDAAALGWNHYYTGEPCSNGHYDWRYLNDWKCVQCKYDNRDRWQENNPEEHKKRMKSYNAGRDRERDREHKRSYNRRHPEKVKVFQSKRRAKKVSSTPSWTDEDELFLIEEAYLLAQERTEQTGFSWHVDHIVPLVNDLVCGLHCWQNLQVTPAEVNFKKSNYFNPEDHYWRKNAT